MEALSSTREQRHKHHRRGAYVFEKPLPGRIRLRLCVGRCVATCRRPLLSEIADKRALYSSLGTKTAMRSAQFRAPTVTGASLPTSGATDQGIVIAHDLYDGNPMATRWATRFAAAHGSTIPLA